MKIGRKTQQKMIEYFKENGNRPIEEVKKEIEEKIKKSKKVTKIEALIYWYITKEMKKWYQWK